MQPQAERSAPGPSQPLARKPAESSTSLARQASPLLSQVSSLIRQPTLGSVNRVVPLQGQSSGAMGSPGLLRRGSFPSQFILQQTMSGLAELSDAPDQRGAKAPSQLSTAKSFVPDQQPSISGAVSLPGQTGRGSSSGRVPTAFHALNNLP